MLFATTKTAAQSGFLIILIFLLAACSTVTVTQQATVAPQATVTSPPPPTLTSVPTITATPEPQQPPACTFPLAQTTTEESKPETYTFSEPKVVKKEKSFRIVEWLPDNQHVLVTSLISDSGDNAGKETIELFNPQTGESKVYTIRTYADGLPLWQPELNAVVYPTKDLISIDKNTQLPTFISQLWISYGDPNAVQMLADDLSQAPISANLDRSETLYFSEKKINKINKSLTALLSVPFDSSKWDYAKARRNKFPVSYQMTWQPNTSLVFLYSGVDFGGGYTFILDSNTGNVCELDFGGWAEEAQWSSDGRYLAFIRSKKYTSPTFSADLTVLDSLTGNLTVLNIIPQEMEGIHFAKDFVWAPDNHYLLVIGQIYISPNVQDKYGLYLVDFLSGQSTNVLSTYSYTLHSIAWSPDGTKVLIGCPRNNVDQLCLIPVQVSGQ